MQCGGDVPYTAVRVLRRYFLTVRNSLVLGSFRFVWMCRGDRETSLIVAIRAGRTSAVELLVQRGAPLDGAGVGGRLPAEDRRPMAAVRAKMMARR